ncbi:MAG: NUDIX hydrolase [Candidatus Aenigmatarchaeota archaeon]
MGSLVDDLLDKYNAEYREIEEFLEKEEFEAARARVRKGLKYGVGALVRHGNKVLLVKNHWSSGWILPGGGVEKDESLEEAVRREIKEETGLRIEVDTPFLVEKQVFRNNGEQVSNYFILFSAGTGSPELDIDNREIEDAEWFSEIPENTRHRGKILELMN